MVVHPDGVVDLLHDLESANRGIPAGHTDRRRKGHPQVTIVQNQHLSPPPQQHNVLFLALAKPCRKRSQGRHLRVVRSCSQERQ